MKTLFSRRGAVLLALFLAILNTLGEIVTWNADTFSIDESFDFYGNSGNYKLLILSNGPVQSHPRGHIRFNISLSLGHHFRPLYAISPCIGLSDSVETIKSALEETLVGEYPLLPGDDTPLDSLFSVSLNTTYNDFGQTNKTLYSYFVHLAAKRSLTRLEMSHSTDDCSAMKTTGEWSDPFRWSTLSVPTSSDSVVIPAEAGAIFVTSNVTVNDLSVYGGELHLMASTCPPGWSVDDRQYNTGKCYRLFDTSVNFTTAERTCNEVVGSGGSDDRHLMHISDAEENDLARRLCRGPSGSKGAFTRGCWIGLREVAGDGFEWLSSSAVGGAVAGKRDAMFLDWRRHEPNNMTVSNGTATYGGEQCVQLVPWQQDPLIVEQGAWADDACRNTRPFICQVFSPTVRFSVTVANATTFETGVVHGGTIVSVGTAKIASVHLLRGAALWLASSTRVSRVRDVVLMDAARLVVVGRVAMYNDARVGDMPLAEYRDLLGVSASLAASPSALYAQSVVVVTSKGALLTTSQSDIDATPSTAAELGCGAAHNITLAARFVVRSGNVTIGACSSLLLQQGGDLAKANVRFVASTSVLSVDGYAAQLSTFDSFNVYSANRGPFIGEYYDGDIAAEYANMHAGTQVGVYRLVVRSRNVSESTACVPYNATAAQLQSLLNALSLVRSYGGATVRRYGDSDSAAHRYGFTYRVDFDAPSTVQFYRGPLTLALQSIGPRDSCAQTKVPLVDASGTAACENYANVSTVDPAACVHRPDIAVERVSTLGFIGTTGSGALAFTAGVHRLPPVTTSVQIVGRSGAIGVVAADLIRWHDLFVGGRFHMLVAGTAWAGWDSVVDLFAPDWDNERGLAALNNAPACDMRLATFSINDLAGVFSTGPHSNFTWTAGEWNGGVLGGRSSLHVTEAIVLNGSNRALRDVMTLTIDATATLTWLAGNLSLANAATVVNEGVFVIANVGGNSTATADGGETTFYPFAMGEADYLNDSSSTAADALTLLEVRPGRSWQSYYAAHMLAELRAGWYLNPLCGESCGSTNLFFIRGDGELRANPSSTTTFVLPVYLVDEARFNVNPAATVAFASGGTFGNDVVVTLGTGARLELSGGRMLMQATCTIQGAGDLQVTGGAHDLSFIIDARITISGGRLTWPQSRGDGNKITFRGGLIIEASGQLIVEPQSTVIQVESDVHFKDNCLIQFPVLGIAAQSTPFDGPDFPDTSPRCTLNATQILRWDGGTIAGKVDIISRSFLYLDGDTKYVASLAKLLNYGHCEWGAGDLVIENNGDFVNYGSIQMALGQAKFDANVVYRGTALPLDNGGDPFAKNFHTYDLDPGGLNYAEYVALNGEYVSILPQGWTEARQIAGDGGGGISH